MKSRVWTWRITGAVVVLLMSWVLLEMIAGARQLKQAKAAIQAKGGSLEWRDILAKVPDEGSNGEADFLAAIDGLARSPSGLFYECFTVPGEKIPLSLSAPIPTEIKEYTSSNTIRRWATNVWLEAEPFIQMGEDNWEFAERAATNDAIKLTLNWNAGAHLRLPHLSAEKSLFVWIRMAALQDLREGNREAALEKVITGFRLLEIYNEPILISALVEVSCASLLWSTVWEMWANDGWSDAQLSRLQETVDSLRYGKAFDLALQMERSITAAEWQRILRDPSALKSRWSGSVSAWELTLASTPFWRIFISNPDLAWYLQNAQSELEAFRTGFQARSRLDHGKAYAKLRVAPPKHYLFSRMYGIAAESTVERAFRGENSRELIVTAIALKRYRLKRGGYPEKLADLLPEFLDGAPVDWMNGKELLYERVSASEFRLWSVGTDGIDNGGDPVVPGSKTDMIPYRGRDWVWPQISSPADIEAFTKGREAAMKKAMSKP